LLIIPRSSFIVFFSGELKRMYCSSCGVAVAQGLSYCNYCGAKLGGAESDNASKSREVRPELLVAATSALFIFGLVAIIMLMGVMKVVLGLTVESVLVFALFPFLLLLLLEGVFIRLLLRSKRNAEQTNESTPLKGQATKELDAAHARALPEPLSSVTEHTTRAFAPLPSDRTSK
jgi:hypothetical protein